MSDPSEPGEPSEPGPIPAAAAASAAAIEAGERPIRRYPAAVSAGAMALAWANQEKAPSGAIVVVTHEVSPLGRLGQLWAVPATSSLAFAVVLRPTLTADEADVPWILGGLAVAEGIEEAGGPKVEAAWPDLVVDAGDGRTVAALRADVQLGPGKVRVAVVTVRLDVSADGGDRRDDLLASIGDQFDRRTAELEEGVAGPIAAYEQRCRTLGHNLKLRLIPRGELRAHAAAIDPLGRLECRSPTGMVERVSVNQVRAVEIR